LRTTFVFGGLAESVSELSSLLGIVTTRRRRQTIVKITKRRKLAMLLGVWEHIAVEHG
jgi:hypothetical protein